MLRLFVAAVQAIPISGAFSIRTEQAILDTHKTMAEIGLMHLGEAVRSTLKYHRRELERKTQSET